MTDEAQVKQRHMLAQPITYFDHGHKRYVLIWSGVPGSFSTIKLGSGKNAQEAWQNALDNLNKKDK
jgi:hypothetical protein